MKTRKSSLKKMVHKWKSKLCWACLSQNRTLTSLSNYKEIYELLCKNIDSENSAGTYLCWECMSLLRKAHEFREKVRKSQDVLHALSTKNLSCPPICFSNLFISEILTVDTFENEPENESSIIDEETNNYDDVEEITALDETEENLNNSMLDKTKEKFIEEAEEEDILLTVTGDTENSDDNNYDSETLVENLPTLTGDIEKDDSGTLIENLPTITEDIEKDDDDYDSEINETKSHNKSKSKRKPKVRNYPNQRNQRYTLTYQSLKWEEAVQKIKINNEELKEWLERERNSDHFRSLKNKCDICLQKLLVNNDIECHKRECHTATSSNPLCCDICRTYFPSKSVLSTHMRKHYFARACNICGFECHSALHMRYHLKKAHTRLVVCSHCEESFKNTREFYVHLKSHSAKSYYYCDKCEKRCKSLHVLEKHIKRTHEVQRCEPCNMTFKDHVKLANHIKLKHTHAPSELSFCAPCNKQFDNEFVYNRHLLTAAVHVRERGEKPKKAVACPICLKVYSQNYTMMNHYRWVHTNDSRYKCEYCDRSFLNRSHYKDHVNISHLGRERPRHKRCRYCSRAFSSNQTLRHHILTHTGEKPHPCPLCSQRFRQKSALNSHLRHKHHKDNQNKDEAHVTVPLFDEY